MIWIREYGTKDDAPAAFQFYEKELPEDISFGKKTLLNKIQYPGGHISNQIIGVYDNEVEWSGVFYGTYFENGTSITAKARADKLMTLMGRPVRVGFPVPGLENAGFKGVFIIEEFVPKIKNYLHVEYTIKLVPHQRQEKIKPEETTNVRLSPSPQNIGLKAQQVSDNAGKSKNNTVNKAKEQVDKAKDIADRAQIPSLRQDKYLPNRPGKVWYAP